MESHTRSTPLIGLITAESLSLLGNQIAAVAIPILVLQFTHSPLVTGVAAAGNIVPIILAAILGGRAIDRFGAWNMSVAADLLSCCSVLALPLAFIYLDQVSPLLVFMLVFMGALFDPTGISARQTLVPGLAESSGKSLDKINSWRGGLENGADFIGPVVGVALISAVGTINTFFIDAISFLLCAIIFAATVPRERRLPSIANEGAGLPGFTFIFEHPQLMRIAVVGMLAGFVILPFLGLLLPVLATQKFGSTTLLGICLSAFGLSATLGAISFSLLSRRCSRSLIYYGGLLITGGSLILCALATNKYEVILSAALAGLLLGAGNPLQQTILQEETPAPIAGRVFTSLTALHFIGGPFGLLVAGTLIQFTNVDVALLSGGALLMVLAIFAWLGLPLLSSKQQPRDCPWRT
jgi:MFS family permease